MGKGKNPSNGQTFSFVNPYNFVPFGDEPKKQAVSVCYAEANELQSGWLDVRVDVRSPLIIPDGAHPETEEGHKKFGFFKIPDSSGKAIPVIPGSSLRGMLRSVYEAASNSCLPFLMDNKPISQRNPLYAGFNKRGLLEYDPKTKVWKLYSAKGYSQRTQSFDDVVDSHGCYNGYRNGDYVPFDVDDCGMSIPKQVGPKTKYGWLQYNKPVNKDGYNIYVLTKNERILRWKAEEHAPYESLRSALCRDGVKGNAPNPNENQRNSLLKALDSVKEQGGCVPVWYLKTENGEVYLSGSSISRVGRRRRWEDIMEGHLPCDRIDALCPACLLFGTTKGAHTAEEHADEGLRGRLRFTDAEPIKITGTDVHTLQILGEPRPSAFEFYLDRPNSKATYWNFDYYSYTNGASRNKKSLHEFESLSRSTPRGRKMYWHGETARDGIPEKMNQTMESVRAGSAFRFRVYFDRITKQQLQDLIWVITLGENNWQSSLLHKLGHARPLGYGSVKLTVPKNGIHFHRLMIGENGICASIETQSVENKPPCSFDTKAEPVRSILAMCNTESVKGLEVCYPVSVGKNKGQPADQIFAWFSKNRQNEKSVRTLPKPTAADITLEGKRLKETSPVYEPEKQQGRYQNTAQNESLKVGDIVTGITTGMNKSGKRVFVRIDGYGNKVNASSYVGKNIPLRKKVKVEIIKYNEQYDNYDLKLLD